MFIYLKEEDKKLYQITLKIIEFKIACERNLPLTLTMKVTGNEQLQEIPHEVLPVQENTRFFYLNDENIRFAGYSIERCRTLKLIFKPESTYEINMEINQSSQEEITDQESELNLTFSSTKTIEANRKADFKIRMEKSNLIHKESTESRFFLKNNTFLLKAYCL